MNQRKQQGFSLIELMIVIAIISILAMVAVPSYQRYTQRARFAEVVNAAQVFKTAVALALQQNAPVEELKNGEHGIPGSPAGTRNLASILVENGVITATGTELVEGKTFVLTPSEDGSTWSVGGTCLADGLCHA